MQALLRVGARALEVDGFVVTRGRGQTARVVALLGVADELAQRVRNGSSPAARGLEDAGIAFWRRAPIKAANGTSLGTVHALRAAEHPGWTAAHDATLRDLAVGLAAHLCPDREGFLEHVEQAPFIVVLTDASARVLGLNQRAAQILEVTPSAAHGKTLWTLLSDPRAARLVRRAWRRLRRAVGTAGRGAAGGELRWRARAAHAAVVSVTPLRDPGSDDRARGSTLRFVVTGVDASDQRRAAETDALALRARADFLNHVTHELRTPLHAISGFSELLLDPGLGTLTPDQTEFAGEIKRAADHLFALISDLLDLSKVGAGAVHLEPQFIATHTLLRGCAAMLEGLAARGGVHLSLDIAPEAGTVYGGERQVRQIIVNLLSNAVKFTPSGGTVTLSASSDGEWQRIGVTDTGIGLQTEDLERIFEPFAQARNSPVDQRSFGLGLTLARRLAELHHGRLEVHSALGVGSTFTLVLPCAASPHALRRAQRQ
jgi:signal transduction histidine kinase